MGVRGVMTSTEAASLLEEVRREEILESVEEVEGGELTEEALESAFKNEVQPWLRREMEKFMNDLDKKMLGIMKGQFPEARMEYGITRYAPLSVGPKDFLKSLGKPYRMWRGKVRDALEGK